MGKGDLAIKSPNSLLFFNCVKQDYEYSRERGVRDGDEREKRRI